MGLKFNKIFFVGNLGWQSIKIEQKRRGFPGGAALHFGLFASLWLSIKMFSVAGPKSKWRSLIKQLAALGIDTEGIEYADEEIHFFTEYSRDFQLQEFKIKNPEIMDGVAKLAKKISLEKGSFFHICPLNFKSQLAFVSLANKRKIPVSLQVHFSGVGKETKNKYFRMFKKVDILFLNREEARNLTGKKGILSSGQKLASYCKGLIFITAADKEVVVFKNGNFLVKTKPIVPKKILNVTGAGDAFAAGVLGGLRHFNNIRKALALGLITANLSLQFESTLDTLNYFKSFYEN